MFWIDATSPETARHSFSAIGKLGGMEGTQSAGQHWLATAEDPWLLIINNADDPSLDIASLFPDGERGYILVTTRNPHLKTQGTVGSKYFKGLEEKEAIQLFLRTADCPKPWDPTVQNLGRQIADALGYLALALVQAGALISQKVCDMREYLGFFQGYRKKIGGRRPSLGATSEDQFAVYATWDHSLDTLQERKLEAGRDAIELLSIVAFYHFEGIRTDIFIRALENRRKASESGIDRSISNRILRNLQARLQPPPILPDLLRGESADTDTYRLRRALNELSSFSLIIFDDDSSSFSLHPLVHAWAKDRLNRSEQSLWGKIALNVLAESILLPPDDSGEKHEEYRRDILIHLDICIRANPIKIMNFSSEFGGFKLPLTLTFHYGWVFVFQDQVVTAAKFGYVYLERGRFEQAAQLLADVKEALVMSRGYKDDKTLKVMLALANNYWGLGRLDQAIELQRKVIDIQKMTLGTSNASTLTSMDQLGKSYWLNGQYKEALEIQTKAVEIMSLTLGQEDDRTVSAMDNLGVTLGSWTRFGESRDIHEQVLQIRRRNLGLTDLDTLTAVNNKAMALKDLGDLKEAKTLMEYVVQQRRFKLGKEHPWTLWAVCYLSKVDIELGLLKEAEDLLVEGIAAAKRSLSGDHLGVLMGVGELARVYARQERWSEAIPMAEDMITRLKRSRGAGHPDTLFAMSRLALAYRMQGRVANALELCKEAMQVSTERLPKEHPLVQRIVEQFKSLQKKSAETGKDLSETNRSSLDRSISQGEAEDAEAQDFKRKQLQCRKTL